MRPWADGALLRGDNMPDDLDILEMPKTWTPASFRWMAAIEASGPSDDPPRQYFLFVGSTNKKFAVRVEAGQVKVWFTRLNDSGIVEDGEQHRELAQGGEFVFFGNAARVEVANNEASAWGHFAYLSGTPAFGEFNTQRGWKYNSDTQKDNVSTIFESNESSVVRVCVDSPSLRKVILMTQLPAPEVEGTGSNLIAPPVKKPVPKPDPNVDNPFCSDIECSILHIGTARKGGVSTPKDIVSGRFWLERD